MTIYNENKDGTLTVTAPVMIPSARDCDYENGEPPLTTEQIRAFAKTYERYGFIDHEHGLTVNGEKVGEPVKSFLLSKDTSFKLASGLHKTYPKGTWMVTSNITDPSAIAIAKAGGYTGYSASVFTKERADEYLKAFKSNKAAKLPRACKSISSTGNSLIKDIEDPVVLSISLVNSPCLHESKFCKLTEEDEIMEEDVKSLKSKVLTAMGMTEEAEVAALKSEVSELKEFVAAMQTDFQESFKQMHDEFSETLAKALTPVAHTEEKDAAAEAEIEEPTEDEKPSEEAEETEEKVVEESEETETHEPQSKAAPVHDNVETAAKKSTNFYAYMGRNSDGTRKR